MERSRESGNGELSLRIQLSSAGRALRRLLKEDPVCLAYALPVPVAAAALFYRSLAALLLLLPLTLPLALREQRDR